jgi:GH15 family glucan-1,4-alpha-glucosidase
MAGYHDMARRHALFYDRMQRPGGTWGMCYYSDGMEGGPLVLQSDTVGHIPWAMWEHYRATGNAAYLRSVYPGMRKTANWAVAWRDPKNGLPLPTFEDDSITPKQGLHGAVSLYMGLEATIKAAGVLKKDALARKGWRRRADELKQAIVDNFWDEEGQTFGGDFHGSWVIWPANLFSPDDPRTVGHARYLKDMLVSRMNLEGDSGGYEGLGIIALSRLWKGDSGKMAFLKSAVAWLARDVATPGTGHFGEFYFMVDWNGDGRKEYVNYSAIPHGWNHALFVISSLEVFGSR